MIYIKILFYFIILFIFAAFTFQNISTLTMTIHINFFSAKNIAFPLYYFLLVWFALLFLILFFMKLKNSFIVSRKNKEIKKLENEINELRKLNIAEEHNNE